MKTLVIVESPTKARTIGKYLGNDYVIKYSMGHVMDLPKSTLGVDVDNNFVPQIEVLADKKKLIAELKSAAKGVDQIILATDPDREGEAIAANIQTILSETKSPKSKVLSPKFSRIVFHEITEGAIKEAMNHPRAVDTNLVDAQTARRVLDRLVGYKLSPLLWQKVRRGLSAGRVQSVALRLIAEREKEIEKFKKEPYWSIHLDLAKKENDTKSVTFDLVEIDEKKIELSESFELYDGTYKISKTVIDTAERAKEIVEDMQKREFVISDVIQRQAKRSPTAPFTTSTLQQDASRRYGYSGKRTMSLAQRLYEEGYITYHRTDSTTMSPVAITQIRDYVKKEYGDKYIPDQPRLYAAKQKSAQEAHEAIRPTKFSVNDSVIHQDLEKDAAKLYDLIWRRAVGSQMSDALIESTTVFTTTSDKGAHDYKAKTTGSVLVFDGFLKINPQALSDTTLPQFVAGESLNIENIVDTSHQTPAPPRYNDASIIATLEEKGIGRPSTYASIIATLVDRAYVERVEKRFEASAVGMAVNDFLVANFADIDDIPFTADMEDKLDLIADGKTEWTGMMKAFYDPLARKLEIVKDADRVKIKTESIDEKCPDCGNDLVVRTGKFGKFISCSTFPACKFTRPFVEETGIICPKDGGNVIVKKTRKGRKFFGCSNYPACNFAAWKLEDIKKKEEVEAEIKEA